MVGRPRKPPTEHAFNPSPYAYIVPVLAHRHLAKVKAKVARPDDVWADLFEKLCRIAEDQMWQLADRYDGRGTPEGYLWRYLPQRCAQPFYEATGQLLFETGCVSLDAMADRPR